MSDTESGQGKDNTVQNGDNTAQNAQTEDSRKQDNDDNIKKDHTAQDGDMQEMGTENGNSTEAKIPYDGIYPQHEPYGEGVGVNPGRVVWAYDPSAVSWNGKPQYCGHIKQFRDCLQHIVASAPV